MNCAAKTKRRRTNLYPRQTPPVEFMSVFRLCGWFSSDELMSVLKKAPNIGKQVAADLREPTNKMLYKYLVENSKLRTAHFLRKSALKPAGGNLERSDAENPAFGKCTK